MMASVPAAHTSLAGNENESESSRILSSDLKRGIIGILIWTVLSLTSLHLMLI